MIIHFLVDELERKYVRYELRQGHCWPTMNLTKPDLHMTKSDCMYTPIRKTMWYIVPEMGYCKFEENVTTRLLKSEYRAWFKTLQECSQYLDDLKKNHKSYMVKHMKVGKFKDTIDSHPIYITLN
uniref:Uncharacterized protein n=1 Tax=Romanomermis culicivorax TaxID=13658 RepID=A0A915L4F2_ROMCU